MVIDSRKLSSFSTIAAFISALKGGDVRELEVDRTQVLGHSHPELEEGVGIEIAYIDYANAFGSELPRYHDDDGVFAVRCPGTAQLVMCWKKDARVCWKKEGRMCFARLLSEEESVRFRELSGSRLDRAKPVEEFDKVSEPEWVAEKVSAMGSLLKVSILRRFFSLR